MQTLNRLRYSTGAGEETPEVDSLAGLDPSQNPERRGVGPMH